jgi:large subunit ribosomal protein L32
MRHTRATTGDRRSHHALTGPRLSKCQKCGEAHLRHHACANCGTYKGREVIDVVAKLGKREQKAKAKAEAKK